MPSISENNKLTKPPQRQAKIVGEIVRRITTGELAPGAQLPPVSRLTETFKTTPVTLSRAMSYLKEHGFVYSQHGIGTFVSGNPSCLCNIGLVLPYKTKSNFVQSLEKEAARVATETAADGLKRQFREYRMVACSDDEIIKYHGDLFAAVEADTLAGLIFVEHTYALLNAVMRKNPRIACVALQYLSTPGSINIQYTGFLDKAMDIAAEHGRRHVAVLTISRKDESYRRIFEAASRRGLTVNSMWVQKVDAYNPDWASNTAELLLAHGRGKIDALIIEDDNVVPGATEGILASGVRVPDEVLVIAHTNFPHITQSMVPAVRVGVNIRDAMHLAVTLIEKQRMGEEVPKKIFLESQSEEAS